MKPILFNFLFCECDYVATPYFMEDTREWYFNETGEWDEEPELIDIENNGLWNEITENEAEGLIYGRACKEGNVRLYEGCMCKYTTFKNELSKYDEIKEPFIIASTEV